MELIHLKFDGGSLTWASSAIRSITRKELDTMDMPDNAKEAIWAKHLEYADGAKKASGKPADAEPC